MASPARPHPSLDAMLLRDHTIRERGASKVAASTVGQTEPVAAP